MSDKILPAARALLDALRAEDTVERQEKGRATHGAVERRESARRNVSKARRELAAEVARLEGKTAEE